MAELTTDRISGLRSSTAIKAPVKCATTTNITLSGTQTIDGVSAVAGDRVLVKDQTTASENGIYLVSATAWSRSKDFDGDGDAVTGTLVYVAGGTVNGASFWRLTTANIVTIGTSNITWAASANQIAGITAFVQTLMDDDTAAAFLTTLGVSAFIQTLLNDTDAATARATLGAGTLDDLVSDTTPQLGGALDTNGKVVNFSKGAAVASASAPNIWVGDGNTLHITGTTTITDFADAPRIGASRWLVFDGILTLTHGSGITLPGGANITTAAGDMAYVYADTVSAFTVVYFKADGTPVVTTGKFVGHWRSQTQVSASGSNNIASDNSTPQSSEGTEFLSVTTGTLKSATNKLLITVHMNIAVSSAGADMCVALFDSISADAIATVPLEIPSTDLGFTVAFSYEMTTGATTAKTFSVRAGASTGTTYINRKAGGDVYNGTAISSITVLELQP